MNVIWHTTKHIHTRVMEVQPHHTLGEWEVYHPYGAGTGVLTVAGGDSPNPPDEIKALCRVGGVWRIIASKDGYFIVTVYEERRWDQIEAELNSAYVIAVEKKDEQKGNS